MSVVDDLGLVMVSTVVVSCTWYGVAPYLSEARARHASRTADRQVARRLGGRPRDHRTTAA